MRRYSHKVKITHDVFDIADRLKEISPDYFVMYDTELGRFEIHSAAQSPDTLSLVLPYDTLDCRAVDLVISTRKEHMTDRIREMEEHNARLEREAARRAAERYLTEGEETSRRLSV